MQYRSSRSIGSLLILLILLGGSVGTRAQSSDAAALARATVVVFNSRAAGSSTLAQSYAKLRNIPERNLIGLDMPDVEEISRAEYYQYISEPLAVQLDLRGQVEYRERSASRSRVLSGLKVRYVVLIRGVPLKIARTPVPVPAEGTPPPAPPPPGEKPNPFLNMDEASVDQELACLLVPIAKLEGPVNNPYYRGYAPVLGGTLPPMLLVCRLDARLPTVALQMVKDAVQVEREGRLWGRAWVDSRGIREGGYAEGDEWLRTARAALTAGGIPVVWDEREALFPPASPVEDCAIYLGWYAWHAGSPWAAENFRFKRGAVAAHIHSFSAATLRNPANGWAGPVLEHGAAATLGNVYEPFLHLTTNLDIFTDRLLQGYTFAEAFYMAQPVLSWMAVAVGDPLYRPFPQMLDLLAPEPEPARSDEIWQKLDALMTSSAVKGGDLKPWVQAAEGVSGRSRENELIWETLAIRQAEAGQYEAALASLAQARKLSPSATAEARCIILQSHYLVALKRKGEAIALLKEILASGAFERHAPALTFYLHELEPPPPPPEPASPE